MSNKEMPMRNHIKRFREERGWSQQELADMSGLSRAGVSAIEMCKLVPSTAAALSLARIFRCRVEDIFQLEIADDRTLSVLAGGGWCKSFFVPGGTIPARGASP